MPRLRPVPDAPLRAIGAIRVSKERENMVSPELQRTAIEDHCARRGYEIVGWVEGIDESGSQRRSAWWAKLDATVAQVEAGEADAIVVWRFSRTARQRLRWAVAIDRVEVAGGLLESATEPLDTSTASGRLARGMLAEFAAYEAEAIGNTWREAHARRTSKGLPANGKARFGYRAVDGVHQPIEPEASVLAELYRRYVAGESFYALAAWLNHQRIYTVPGYSARGGGPWSQPSLRNMLDKGFAAGWITVHGERIKGAHQPIVSDALWNSYLAARQQRRHYKRGERSPFLLSSLVWCRCGSKMGGSNTRYGPMMRCLAANDPAGNRHPGQHVYMAPVEDSVWEWITALADRLNRSADKHLAARAHTVRRKQDAKALARQVIELDKAMGRLVAQQAQLPEIAYRAGLDELMQQRSALEERRVQAEADAAAGEPAKIAADLLAYRYTGNVEGLRAMLRHLVARIEVTATGTRPTGVNIVPVDALRK